MLSRSIVRLSLAAGLATAAIGLGGCTSCYTNDAPAPKRQVVVRKRAKKAAPARVERSAPAPSVSAGGATSIEVSPGIAVNPVRTQHVLVATVRDSGGRPVSGERVEWIVAGGGVGDIVDVDGGEKIDNTFAVSHTSSSSYTLDRGNDDPSDDVSVGPGQTWCVITSSAEGSSNVVAYAPGIANWDNHKAFATKNWMDVTWEWPVDATNKVGSPHVFSTRVMRYSDGTPLVGYMVNYEIISGPAGSFQGGSQMVSVKTDGSGVASATLNQSSPAVGMNDVEVTIIRPANSECCVPEKQIIAGVVRKTWVSPSIACSKTGPDRVTEGDTFDYVLTASNTGDMDVGGVTMTDALPDGLTYVSSAPAATVTGNRVVWNLGNIEAMGTRTMTVTVRADRVGMVENCGEMTAEGGLKSRCCTTTTIDKRRSPALAITCTCPDMVLVCDPITWRCTVTNNGDGPANDVRITCRVPDGLVCDGSTGQTEHWIGTLGPGESRSIESTCTATRAARFTKTCEVSASNANTAEASCSVTVKQPSLAITKRSTRSEWKVGRPIQWEITVRSTGDIAARDVVLTDMVPAGTTFESATDGGMNQGGTVAWNLGSMEPGQERTVSMTVRANSIGVVRNTASVRAYCADDVSANAETNVTGVAAILLELIDVDDPIEVGNTETYVIDVTNQGSIDDTNVIIMCTLPAEQEFVSADGSGAGGVSHRVSGKVVTFDPLPRLGPKARATYRITVRATGVGDVRFAVQLDSDVLSSPVNENESTHQY